MIRNGYTLFPSSFSLKAYAVALENPMIILRAYVVTLFITVVRTISSVSLMPMTASAIHKHTFRIADGLAFFFFFTHVYHTSVCKQYLRPLQRLLYNLVTNSDELRRISALPNGGSVQG
ncbi:hypothetical protein FE296_26275 [Paenibacillus sp. UASWS1643]|nr:hypothetical protein FE296_26275 [Paenibacillus sp. UASWS1643]